MIADVRMRTNMENSTFCTDAELTEYLNQALAKLWRRLCQNAGQPFSATPLVFTVYTRAAAGVATDVAASRRLAIKLTLRNGVPTQGG